MSFSQALSFAQTKHADQYRKGTHVPYVTHVVAVAETLTYFYPDNEALHAAGLLHDVVEDTDTTLEEVKTKFGPRVAELVAAVTKEEETPGLPTEKVARWRAQREGMLAHLGDDKDVLRLKTADADANLSSIARDLANPAIGESIWSRFKVGREDSLWYYAEILKRVKAGLGDEPIVEMLRERLEGLK